MSDTLSPAVRPVATVVRRPAPGRRFTLYLRSRHVPGAIGLLAAFGAFLWADLYWHWSVAGGPAAQQLVPLVTIAGVASIAGVTTYGALGEPEIATGRSLPYLRLGSSVLLGALAVGSVLGGATGGPLIEGDLGLVRDAVGSIGIALLAAALVGGAFAWVGPVAYWLVIESALEHGVRAFYLWPTRPAHDTAAYACAVVVALAGLAAVTVRPVRPPGRSS